MSTTNTQSKQKKYYEANKDRILAEEKDKKRWLSYYERNRATAKEKARARYYTKRGLDIPPPRPPPMPETPDMDKLIRLEKMIGEFKTLIGEIHKPKRKEAPVQESPSNSVILHVAEEVPVSA